MKRSQFILSLVLLACMFFIFGLVSWVNATLVPYFKVACDLDTQFKSYLVTFAFNIAYLVVTIPAGVLLSKVGYKKGTLIGMFILAAGALLFWPAAQTRTYWLFLLALFTMGTAMAILQNVANPFVTIIGSPDTTVRRFSVMGVCNKTAGILSPMLFAAAVIRPQDKVIMEQVASGELIGEAKELALNELVRGVIPPYLVLAAVFVIFGLLFYKSPIPDINPDKRGAESGEGTERKSILAYPYLVLGIIALFCHLGSQQLTVNTIVGYAAEAGYANASIFPSFTLGCILIGYLFGVVTIPKLLSQKTALLICTISGILLSLLVLVLPIRWSVICLVLLGFSNSIVYSGIWAMAIPNLGKWTSLGSSLLVMALCGNAIMPLLYGAASDRIGLQAAYWPLLPCFIFMFFYTVYGHKIQRWSRIS